MPQTSKKHLVAKPLRDPFDIKDSGGEVPPHLAEGHLADGSASPAWWQAHRKCTLGGRSQRHQGDGKDACLKNPLRPPQKLNGVVPRTCPRKVHLRGAHSHVQHAKDSMWFKVAGDRIRMILRAIGDEEFDVMQYFFRTGDLASGPDFSIGPSWLAGPPTLTCSRLECGQNRRKPVFRPGRIIA